MTRYVSYNIQKSGFPPIATTFHLTKQIPQTHASPLIVMCVCAPVSLTTESIKGLSLSLESIYNIERGDSLAFGVFSVGNSISDNAFKEHLQDTARLLIDETRDTLDTSTTSKTTNRRLRYSLL